MNAQPQKEHEWLQKLVGEWTSEAEMTAGKPGEDPERSTGTESVRSLGGYWIVAEGAGSQPCGGGEATTVLTLGYDTHRNRYVGTWVGSMMPLLWVYDGELDATGNKLTLSADGPDFVVEGKTAKYQDVIEFHSHDHRTLTSYVQAEDGSWTPFMTAHYRRKK
jgi:Protein of unknown function (DUF1579).